jgi:hypothetical protein
MKKEGIKCWKCKFVTLRRNKNTKVSSSTISWLMMHTKKQSSIRRKNKNEVREWNKFMINSLNSLPDKTLMVQDMLTSIHSRHMECSENLQLLDIVINRGKYKWIFNCVSSLLCFSITQLKRHLRMETKLDLDEQTGTRQLIGPTPPRSSEWVYRICIDRSNALLLEQDLLWHACILAICNWQTNKEYDIQHYQWMDAPIYYPRTNFKCLKLTSHLLLLQSLRNKGDASQRSSTRLCPIHQLQGNQKVTTNQYQAQL